MSGTFSTPAVVVALSALALTACGSSGEDGAVAVADEFYAALADRDGSAACGLLAPATRSELEQSAGAPCPQAIVEERLPRTAGAEATETFDSASIVRYQGETAFLAHFDDGWRVVAAGCTPRPPHPYDCTISGG